MPMPEAAVYEDGLLASEEDNVGLAVDVLPVKPVARESLTAEDSPYSKFGLCVPAPDAPHVVATAHRHGRTSDGEVERQVRDVLEAVTIDHDGESVSCVMHPERLHRFLQLIECEMVDAINVTGAKRD